MSDYKWKIWYEGGTVVVGSSRTEWEQSPSEGVLAVYEFLGHKSNGVKLGRINSGVDWYWMNGEDDHIDHCGESHIEVGQWTEPNTPMNAIVKRGKQVADAEMLIVESELLLEICNV